jgi:hypothetical protein
VRAAERARGAWRASAHGAGVVRSRDTHEGRCTASRASLSRRRDAPALPSRRIFGGCSGARASESDRSESTAGSYVEHEPSDLTGCSPKGARTVDDEVAAITERGGDGG